MSLFNMRDVNRATDSDIYAFVSKSKLVLTFAIISMEIKYYYYTFFADSMPHTKQIYLV